VFKLYSFESKECKKKIKIKNENRWSTSSRVYIPFHSFLSWKKKTMKKEEERDHYVTYSLHIPFHSFPFLFWEKEKENRE
jgi:hypothetical protein